MQETAQQSYDVMHTTVIWIPADSGIDSTMLGIGTIYYVGKAPMVVLPNPLPEPYHIGGCI